MAITIAIISYYKLTEVINKAKYVLPPGVNIKLINCNLLINPTSIAQSMELRNEADVFVSAGSNFQALSTQLQAPLVEIKVSLTDVLLAMREASKTSNKVALLKYNEEISYLNQIKSLFKFPIVQCLYKSGDEVNTIIDQLYKRGFTTFIGSSLIYESATARGLSCCFVYSVDSVIRALETAVKIAQIKQREMVKTEELQTILKFTHEGIIATNSNDVITVFNPSAEKIIGIPERKIMAQNANDVLPELNLKSVRETKESILNQVQTIADVKILTNRIPIITKQGVAGTIVTFNDIGMVQKAEKKIRETLYRKGFTARIKFDDILGTSEAIQEVKNIALRYARWKSSILIMGDSGTGKELFAQAIHNASLCSDGPFVAINCAALPENLLESELFGYENGAFTGAKKGGKQGLFELAHNGTIFLDEIADMPMAIQSRVLRVLEEHEVLRIGGEKLIPIDIRIIAATNKNLWEMVQSGNFRDDLYYRLCVLELSLPALSNRKEDIVALIVKFLKDFRPDLPEWLVQRIAHNPQFADYHWRGNVRQLRNIIERFSVLFNDETVAEILIGNLLQLRPVIDTYDQEREKLVALLKEVKGNKSKAAQLMGISRTTLWRKLRIFGVSI